MLKYTVLVIIAGLWLKLKLAIYIIHHEADGKLVKMMTVIYLTKGILQRLEVEV